MPNIGSLRSNIREVFLVGLQDFRVDLVIGQGSGARVHPFHINRFTCIATATRESDCPPELREAFAMVLPIESYEQPDLLILAHLISKKLGVKVDDDAAKLISGICGGIPHQIENIIQRLAKLNLEIITEKDAVEALTTYGVNVSTGGVSQASANLQNLTGIQFEQLITSFLARQGFRAQMTKASGDGGIDIVAVLDKPLVGGKCLIQCKRFAANALIGAAVVREFYGAVSADQKVVKGILITTSGFTEQARTFAEEVGIELIDMELLSRLLAGQDVQGTVTADDGTILRR
jgi:hypothetical protein